MTGPSLPKAPLAWMILAACVALAACPEARAAGREQRRAVLFAARELPHAPLRETLGDLERRQLLGPLIDLVAGTLAAPAESHAEPSAEELEAARSVARAYFQWDLGAKGMLADVDLQGIELRFLGRRLGGRPGRLGVTLRYHSRLMGDDYRQEVDILPDDFGNSEPRPAERVPRLR